VHCRCQGIITVENRREKPIAPGLTGIEHDTESCTIWQVEEFWVNDKCGHCCQIPQHMYRDMVSCVRSLTVTKIQGEKDHFPWNSPW
jgi:hypothetical protein